MKSTGGSRQAGIRVPEAKGQPHLDLRSVLTCTRGCGSQTGLSNLCDILEPHSVGCGLSAEGTEPLP